MENYILFLTATIVEWKPLLRQNKYKTVIIDSLKFLVENKRIFLYGFVIMPNHIHILWRIREEYKLNNVQRDFLKFTAQQIKFDMMDSGTFSLDHYKKDKSDRKYQFWQRNSRNSRIFNRKVFEQKLHYIHLNPLQNKWRLAHQPEDYLYSSARFYMKNEDDWGILTHYFDHII